MVYLVTWFEEETGDVLVLIRIIPALLQDLFVPGWHQLR